jgi:hypothetical protein
VKDKCPSLSGGMSRININHIFPEHELN